MNRGGPSIEPAMAIGFNFSSSIYACTCMGENKKELLCFDGI